MPDSNAGPRAESEIRAGTAPASAAICIRSVSKSYGGVPVLSDINLVVRRGECVALIGASGCGKTTLLRLLAGLEAPTGGEAQVFGAAAAAACANRDIGMAFQRSALVPSRTALANVELTLTVTGRTGSLPPAALLERFGLAASLHRYPHQLSGGMQQRVNIACALVHDPLLLLLDEPFGALDELTREDLVDWLSGILEGSRQTAVLVTHSVEEAVSLADRIVVLTQHPGRIARVIEVPIGRPRGPELRQTPRYYEVVRAVKASLHAAIKGLPQPE